MKPHVKFLRKNFQARVRIGNLKAADTCEKCLAHKSQFTRPLELHHRFPLKDVDPESGYDPNVQENLSTLCHTCHTAFHACYEELPFDDFINNIPLDEMRSRLKDYRDEKDRRRAIAIAKHRGKGKQKQ